MENLKSALRDANVNDIPFEKLRQIADMSQNNNDGISSDDDSSIEEEDSDNNDINNHHPLRPIKYSQALVSSNRKRPLEVSSKVPVSAPTSLMSSNSRNKKYMSARDPRFSDFSGKLNVDLFSKSYKFLEDLQQQEKQELFQKLKKPKRPLSEEKKAYFKRQLDRFKSIEQHRKNLREEGDLKRKLLKEEKENIIKTGKTPYIYKKSKLKQILQEEKFKELKKANKLNKHLAKLRKKKTAKERSLVPTTRRYTTTDENN